MSATEPLCQIIGVNPKNLTKEEILILEAELFLHICEGLRKIIIAKYIDYFRLIKFNTEMENTMIEINFIRYITNDILSTEEYSVSGIAYYTNSPEDVIHEIIAGNNTNPSLTLSRKIIELHRSVRPSLYQQIIKKINCMSDVTNHT